MVRTICAVAIAALTTAVGCSSDAGGAGPGGGGSSADADGSASTDAAIEMTSDGGAAGADGAPTDAGALPDANANDANDASDIDTGNLDAADADAEARPRTCTLQADGGACSSCSFKNCCPSQLTCEEDSVCAAALSTYFTCIESNGQNCGATFVASDSANTNRANDLYDCLANGHSAPDCSVECGI